MLNLPSGIGSISLASARSGRGSQASSTLEQPAEAPLQKPVDRGDGVDPAQPLLAVESSPPAPFRLHRAAGAGDVEQVISLWSLGRNSGLTWDL